MNHEEVLEKIVEEKVDVQFRRFQATEAAVYAPFFLFFFIFEPVKQMVMYWTKTAV